MDIQKLSEYEQDLIKLKNHFITEINIFQQKISAINILLGKKEVRGETIKNQIKRMLSESELTSYQIHQKTGHKQATIATILSRMVKQNQLQYNKETKTYKAFNQFGGQ